MKKTGQINWNKLNSPDVKKAVSNIKKNKGTQAAINYVEGYLGLQYGEYGKYKPRIKKYLQKLK
jgi:hypothetical protein